MFEPKRILVTRDGSDSFHENLKKTPAVMMGEPSVGECLRMFLETGKMMTTSEITKVENDNGELVVETRNSTYHVKIAA
jgi:hypothetical protein